MKEVDWKKVQEFYDTGKTQMQTAKEFCMSRSFLERAIKNKLIKIRSEKSKHSPETKLKLSLIRKEFLTKNPEKHPWKSKNKFKSKPCEQVKSFLKELNVQFIEEFDPEIPDRFFSVDIALPEKMIAIEINGQQHYNSDGSLKDYYQERHNLLENNGWKVFEVHYSACFKFEKWEEFVNLIKNEPNVREFDYFNYVPRIKKVRERKTTRIYKPYKPKIKKEKAQKQPRKKRELKSFCQCGNEKSFDGTVCKKCYLENKSKHIPDKETLESLVKSTPMTHIGKMFGVSDNAVKKWCKKLKIVLPVMRGFWQKKQKQERLIKEKDYKKVVPEKLEFS